MPIDLKSRKSSRVPNTKGIDPKSKELPSELPILYSSESNIPLTSLIWKLRWINHIIIYDGRLNNVALNTRGPTRFGILSMALGI